MHKLARIIAAAFAFAMCAALTVEARSITGVSRHFSQGQMLLDVTFEAGEPGDEHALYIAYDTEDKGADISNWAALQRGCVVADDATSATIPVSPLMTGAGYTFCRVFFTTSAAPYDTLIEWLRQTGPQYIDTGIRPNGGSAVAVIDAKLDSNATRQQRFFGVSSSADDTAKFSFDCYINGNGYFASACKDGEGDWKSTEKFTTDRVRISLSAADKHRVAITNVVTGAQIINTKYSTTCSSTSVANLLIFAQNQVVSSSATPRNYAAGANLYSFTLTQGGSCVCDYKPCKLGNRAGVYDSVTDTIIYSASGTDFDAANSGSPIACSLLAGETQLAAAPSATDLFVPVYAKMVKGEGDVYAWRFYNDDWDDITDACGLSVPDSTIKVYVTSTEEVAPILANPGTPAGYRIGNLSADADLTSLSPLVIETGSEIDLNGHALTVSGSVVDALKSSTKDLVVNGNFEAKSLSDNAYDTSAISGWSKSGTVALIKNNSSYAYKQSAVNGSGEKQNTTVMCYIAKSGYITQTINVPEQVLCTLSLNKTNKNYYNGGKKYSTSDGSVQIDGSSKTTLASNAGNQGSISTKFELAAGSHTLKIACTSGTGFSVDNVKLTCTPSTATITSSAAGGELHVNVPSGSTVTNSAVSITGHVKFVKEGAGTFVSKRTELYYDGGNEIVEGKLTTAEGSGSNRDWSAAYRTLGATGKTMTVRKNGTLDIAGNYEYGNYLIVLDGGTLRSGKVIDTGPINQTTNTSWAGIGQLSLTTNSTFYLRGDTLFSGWDSVPIKLNGHELQFQLDFDSKSVWTTKDMTNGTIRLTSANAGKRRFVIFKRNVDARTVDVIDEAGCISPVTTFSVRNYTSTVSSGNDWWKGTANMYVYGTFTPATDCFYGCTMMGGSTIDLSGRSGAWSTTSAHDCGRRTVDFANGATIYVKLGDRHGFSSRTPVIGWTTRPSNLDGLTFKRAEGNVKMVKKDDGVYLAPGLSCVIR